VQTDEASSYQQHYGDRQRGAGVRSPSALAANQSHGSQGELQCYSEARRHRITARRSRWRRACGAPTAGSRTFDMNKKCRPPTGNDWRKVLAEMGFDFG